MRIVVHGMYYCVYMTKSTEVRVSTHADQRILNAYLGYILSQIIKYFIRLIFTLEIHAIYGWTDLLACT